MVSSSEIYNREIKDIIKWFKKNLINAQAKGYITSKQLPLGLRDTYNRLLEPEESYIDYRLKRKEIIKEFLGVDHPIIIFGCGIYGREALEYLKDMGYAATGFMDNSEKLWGRYIDGIIVEPPKKMIEMGQDVRYIIANENYADEIERQIKEVISEAKVLSF